MSRVTITVPKDGTRAVVDCEHIGLSKLRPMVQLALGDNTPPANRITWLQASSAFCDQVQKVAFLNLKVDAAIELIGDTYTFCVGVDESKDLMDAVTRVKQAFMFFLDMNESEVAIVDLSKPTAREGGVDLSVVAHRIMDGVGVVTAATGPFGSGTPSVSTTGGTFTHDPYTGEALKGHVTKEDAAPESSDEDNGRWRSPRAGARVTTVEVNPYRP